MGCRRLVLRRGLQASHLHDAALQADLDPDRLSFTSGLCAARRSARTQPGFSPPNPRQRP
jgi:hypothetical protein